MPCIGLIWFPVSFSNPTRQGLIVTGVRIKFELGQSIPGDVKVEKIRSRQQYLKKVGEVQCGSIVCHDCSFQTLAVRFSTLQSFLSPEANYFLAAYPRFQ